MVPEPPRLNSGQEPHDDGPSSPAVAADGLGRAFRTGLGLRRQAPALAGLTLRIPPGSTVGLVGPNGSGKSTLLRLIAGVDRPTSGTVSVFGRSVGRPEIQRRLAFLPDGQPFPPEMSAGAAMHLIAALKGMPRRERKARVPRMLNRVGLGDRTRTQLSAFSRGMHRRFGLGQAFLTDPDLVLLDEPTAGLDAPGFDVLADVLGEARGRGATIVLASHVASDLIDHCDRLVLLAGGRLLREGSPDELLGAREEVDVRIRGASAAEVESALGGIGPGEIIRVRPARRSLLELYADEVGGGHGQEPRK